MLKLLVAAGLLTLDENGELCKLTAATADIEFYWVVPPARFYGWTQKVAKKYKGEAPRNWEDGNLSRLQQLEKAVKQEAEAERTDIMKEIEEISRTREENWTVFCKCFHTHVEQFVLEMPVDPSFSRNEEESKN